MVVKDAGALDENCVLGGFSFRGTRALYVVVKAVSHLSDWIMLSYLRYNFCGGHQCHLVVHTTLGRVVVVVVVVVD